jgi:MoaA/NifB/PqqE/SkfB family radical SAM enzyme
MEQTNSFQYSVEIVGSCNLRCPSCPVGNMRTREVAKKMIPKELFCKIIDKIKKEKKVEKPLISLFDWGEPTLHPDLPFFVRYINEASMRPRISSNLNVNANFEEILKENPYEFKISLSGFNQDKYKLTHARGNIDKVKSNMNKLRYLADKLKIDTKFIVGYHVYKHNLKNEYDEMKKLSDELGFIFEPDIAMLMPIEKTLSLISNEKTKKKWDLPDIDEKDENLIKNLLSKPKQEYQKWKNLTNKKDNSCKRITNKLAIRVDGTVPICCGVYSDKYIVDDNFLNTPHEELQKKRNNYDFCADCIDHGTHSNWKNSKRTFINKMILKNNFVGGMVRKFLHKEIDKL